MTPDTVVFPAATAMATAAAEHVIASAANALRERGEFIVALSGGSTPRALYDLLATPSYASRIDWWRVQVLWSDERCVPPDDAASNYRMANEVLLSHVPVQSANIHRMRGEDGAEAAAAAYERELRAVLRSPVGPPRTEPGSCIDLVLLGLGEDGHTASLFPGMLPPLPRDAFAAGVPAAATPRVTMTPAVINAAADVLFLVAGSAKAEIVNRVLGSPRRLIPEFPVQLIAPANGRVRWLLDRDAARDLKSDVTP